jgi:hypothetical protein
VVTEADADRAFYEEINRRLEEHGEGADDALFLNVPGWTAVSRVLGPLRRLGIAAAAILDLDTLTEGGNWAGLYDAMALDAAAASSLEADRLRCEVHLRALGPGKPHKASGLAALTGSARDDVERFLAELARFGIFLVPVGELEGWLRPLGITGSKRQWILAMLDRLGSNPSAAAYVAPADDDVWAFLGQVGHWTGDPNRLGLA